MRALCAVTLVWLAWLLSLPPRPAVWLVALSGVPVLTLASRVAYRGHAGPWRTFAVAHWDMHTLALILLVALGVQFADTHGITTDGVIYFTQLRSVIFDGDLDVAAEFAFLGQPPRPSHVVPIGPTFVWLPLYLGVAVVDAIARAAGFAGSTADPAGLGLSLPYVRAALVSSFAIGAVGLCVIQQRLRGEFPISAAFAATVMLFAATPLVWYMVYEPAMTHAASFGFVAVFVVLAATVTRVDMPAVPCVALGAMLGLAFMTRPQEAVFALFPATLLLLAGDPWRRRLRAAMRLGGWAFLGAAPFLALQAVHSTILLGREPFALGGAGAGYLNFLSSRWADTLWSSRHGFLSWTPVAYLACVAMLFYVARNRGWAIAAVLIVLVMAWVNGSTVDWAAGWSFGGRRFISVLAVLGPGLALMVDALLRRPLVAVSIVAAAAIGWNQLLLMQTTRGLLRADAPVSFAQLVRQQAALATGPSFVYPFAFPANVLFAWRTGLPIARYDLLGSEPLHGGIDLEMTGAETRYLTDGWGGRVTDPFGSMRWIEGDRAELLLPLELPPGREVTVSWSARTRRLDPPETATFAIVINGRETFRFTPDTDQSSFFSFTVPADDPLWQRGFNHVAFERRAGPPPLGVYRFAVQN